MIFCFIEVVMNRMLLTFTALLLAPLASLRATENNSVAHPANVLEAGEPAARQKPF